MSRPLVLLAVLMAVLCHGQAPAAAPAMKLGALPPWETSASAPLRPLPAGCRLLEYVESTGEQYVDTGIPAAAPIVADVLFEWKKASIGQDNYIFGRSGSGDTRLYFGTYQSKWMLGYKTYSQAGTPMASTKYHAEVVLSNGVQKLVVNGTTMISTTKTGSLSLSGTMPLFARLHDGVTDRRFYSKTKLYNCKILSGSTVRDYIPVKDANGVAGLWDRVSGQIYYSATATPLVAGPLVVDPDAEPAALLPKSRNWYAPWLLATNPPAAVVTGNAFAFDALVLPEGLYATHRSASEIVVAERPMIEAMVQRYRTGLAPTNLPVNIDHASTNVVGRVTRLWHVAGSGLWVRIEVPAAACSGKPFLSAEVLCLRATASDAWGAWGDFELPWTLRGVALTAEPAISGTRYRLLDYAPSATGAYPDPRTVNATWTPRR